MDAKFKSSIYGIIAAISYGTNPLGALSLYEARINTKSVLFYRFLLGFSLGYAEYAELRGTDRVEAWRVGQSYAFVRFICHVELYL